MKKQLNKSNEPGRMDRWKLANLPTHTHMHTQTKVNNSMGNYDIS